MPGNAGFAFSQSGLIGRCLNYALFKFACWALIWSHPFLIVTYIAKRCELPDKCRLRAPQGTDREGLAFWTLFLVCKKVHPKCTVSILNRHLGGKKNSSGARRATKFLSSGHLFFGIYQTQIWVASYTYFG